MNLTWIDFSVIGLYFVGLLVFGLIVRRIRTFSEYAVGGRAVPTAMIFASLAATYIGPGYTLGFAAKGYASGFLFFFVALAFTLQTLLAGLFVAPRLHRHKQCFTVGDVMGQLYGKGAHLATGVVTLLLTVGFVAIMGKVGGLVLMGAVGTPLWVGVAIITGVGVVYTLTGGIKSVIATDSAQFVIFAVAVPVLVMSVLLMSNVNLGETATAGWAAMRSSVSEMGWLQVTGLFVSFFLGETLIPPYANRALAAGSEQIARIGFLAAAGYSVLWFGMVVGLGVMGSMAVPSVAPDEAFMALTTRYMPHGMVGLIIVAIAAIIMSSQESVLNAGSVSFTRDILGPFWRSPKPSSVNIRISRITTLLVAVLASIFALRAPSIIDGLLVIYSLWAPSVLPALVLGLILPRPVRLAGLPAMLTGAALSLAWQFLLQSPLGFPPILVGLAGNLIVYTAITVIVRVGSVPAVVPTSADSQREAPVD